MPMKEAADIQSAAGRHAVVEGRHAAPGDVVLRDLDGAGDHADEGVHEDREAHEHVAEDAVRHPDLLEDGDEDDEGDEAACVDAVDLAEVVDEIAAAGLRLSCHAISPHSSSLTPHSRSIWSWRRANQNSITTKTIREPLRRQIEAEGEPGDGDAIEGLHEHCARRSRRRPRAPSSRT
jgi:hypothetical protein